MKYKKISKCVFAGPPADDRLDMELSYQKQPWYIKMLVFFLGYIGKLALGCKIKKIRMEGVKPPYILLCNHNSFFDYLIMFVATVPYIGVYPAAPNVFLGKEKFLRKVGCVPKRKYTKDISLIRLAKRVVKNGDMMCIFVEARHSLCGKTEVISDSVGQMAKHLGVPVVTLRMSGHHLSNPFWNVKRFRLGLGTEALMTQIYTSDELKTASNDEINKKIKESLYNDDFRWQSKNRKKIKSKNRAKGLHNALYQCPCCLKETMNSSGSELYCEHCGKRWSLNYYGELEANDGKTEFKFPTDWYDWEREQVKKEVADGTYYFESDCVVNDLPNSKGFVRLGKGKFVHDMEGYHLNGIQDYDGKEFSMEIPASDQYACHVEFEYKFGGFKDCICLNTLDYTWYVYPENPQFNGTKISLATEEIFNKLQKDKQLVKS